MKKLINIVTLSALAGILVACGQSTGTNSSSAPATSEAVKKENIDWSKAGPDAKAHKISFEQVAEDVKNGAVFYDVRSKGEFDSKNFGITKNFPITDLEDGKLPDLPKDTKIYVHCLKGIRSAEATKILRDAGFTNVYDMGGMEHVTAIGGIAK
ncbi:MAG: rhodanese-like domain-containing protein [Gemella sp.]|nr:rhodanese-like domain-containing protein [Gemella sp.]